MTPQPDVVPVYPRPGVAELRRAWRAVQAGHFRHDAESGETPGPHMAADGAPPAELSGSHRDASSSGPTSTAGSQWRPDQLETIVPVLGSHGGSGATTTALALATAWSGAQGSGAALRAPLHGVVPGGVRLVECSSRPASGLTAGSTVELGATDSGLWQQGRVETPDCAFLLQRLSAAYDGPGQVPVPDDVFLGGVLEGRRPRRHDHSGAVDGRWVTVLDCGWDPWMVLRGTSWLSDGVRSARTVVVTGRASVPGLRRMEQLLGLLSAGLADDGRTRDPGMVAVVLGERISRWPGLVRQAVGPHLDALRLDGRLVVMPLDRNLARRGLDGSPLPAAVTRAAVRVRDLLEPNPPDPHLPDPHPEPASAAGGAPKRSRP